MVALVLERHQVPLRTTRPKRLVLLPKIQFKVCIFLGPLESVQVTLPDIPDYILLREGCYEREFSNGMRSGHLSP